MEEAMLVFEFIYYTFLILAVFFTSWLLLITCFSWFHRSKIAKIAPLLHLGVLIPAHNEEKGIVRTLDALTAADYPSKLIDVFVLADNCSDETARVAAARAGVHVIERCEPAVMGKGAALDWFLKKKQRLYGKLDGLVFIDADSIPDRNMLKELSASLSHPEVSVVQGFNTVLNAGENYRTALLAAAFNVFNHLRMAGNYRLFGSASLKGLGMAFRTDILKKYGWPAKSMVEDQELSLLLGQENIPVHYNPQAIIRSEMETDGLQAEKQRVRWEGGRIGLINKYVPRFLLRLFKGQLSVIPQLMELIIPPLSLLVFLTVVLFGLSLAAFPQSIAWVIMIIAVLCFYVASAQLQRGLDIKCWAYLLTAPVFVVWKLCIYVKMIFNGQAKTWGRTMRGA